MDKNRHTLDRIINCNKLCGTHKPPLRGHDESETSHNRGTFLDLKIIAFWDIALCSLVVVD
jgi:hypothetical protein